MADLALRGRDVEDPGKFALHARGVPGGYSANVRASIENR
jgi:hypothetical protein